MHNTLPSPPHSHEGRKDTDLLSGLRIGEPLAPVKSSHINNSINNSSSNSGSHIGGSNIFGGNNFGGMQRHTLSRNSREFEHGHGGLSKVRQVRSETQMMHAQSMDSGTDAVSGKLHGGKQTQRMHSHSMDGITDMHMYRNRQPSPEIQRVYAGGAMDGMGNVTDAMYAHVSGNKKASHETHRMYARSMSTSPDPMRKSQVYMYSPGAHAIYTSKSPILDRNLAHGRDSTTGAIHGHVHGSKQYIRDAQSENYAADHAYSRHDAKDVMRGHTHSNKIFIRGMQGGHSHAHARSLDSINDADPVNMPMHVRHTRNEDEVLRGSHGNRYAAKQSVYAHSMDSISDDMYTPIQYSQIQEYINNAILTSSVTRVRSSDDLYVENAACDGGVRGVQTQNEASAKSFSGGGKKSQQRDDKRVTWT